jgi:hypothetical protein
MKRKYLKPQHTLKVGVGPNGQPADGWWYGEQKELSVYITANDGGGCHWAKIPRRSIEAWLRATAPQTAVTGEP